MAQTAEQLEQQYGREAMAQALDAKRRYDLYGVHFEVGQATIQPQSQSLLDDIAEVMKSFPTWRLEIVGHTDAAGEPAQNESLSRARADAVMAALVQRGIAEGRLVPQGMGEAQPVASNDTPEGRALNRRVELVRLEPQPNILVIWGDDIGWYNISAYNLGVMGYQTPNIDRIAREGALFTDWYGQQSCTAGRAAFATGQSPVRTGLTKVGLPGAPEGLSKSDPTIADLLKPLGYATGQFGKNHLGDRNEHLPTVHGFDEFFGNLYHLNAEEEPENIDYPKNPAVQGQFRPARRAALLRHRPRRGRRGPALRRLGQAEVRGHRAAHRRADGDGRPGVPDRRGRLHRQGAPGQPAVLRLVQLDPDAHLDPSGARRRGQDRDRRLPRRHGRA